MTALLATQALCKSFGPLVVTDHVDFVLWPGARHALIGPNGAGKTTFVNLLTGNLRPTSGTISLLGEDVTSLSFDSRVRKGLVRTFQINQLLMALSVLENVQLAVLERERVGSRPLPAVAVQRRAAEEALDLLEAFGLAEVALDRVATLPYGRQRLVEVVVAMAMRPKVLLLDEPAAGVPPSDSRKMMELIGSLPGDMAVLIIEHDMDLVFRFAQEITVLAQGAVLCQGNPGQIVDNPLVREVYLGTQSHG
ncbi:ABC transporter ATP-binding protein [Bosea sp. TND4EK4]|uniref:ABC transporter ATP-binding protein n=1 Tax=Bosea sp. TND4EK4 TaxID=1907408 RepID=UPI000953E532|nr:ABC transporter ATP-binding protein [Bosea sp. TND4EK4]SIR46114.1 amino acid/amide ABC transporter ATP-binding protein 1, HAAT family [Bosea sp. TND4EK4]